MSLIQGTGGGLGGAGAPGGALGSFYSHLLDQSLKFNDDESQYLSRTPASASNRKTWTWSAWVKRGNLGLKRLFTAGTSGSSYLQIRFDTNDEILCSSEQPSTVLYLKTTQKFRDTSAWYHLVVVMDTTQSTAADRTKLYVNGSLVTNFSSTTRPSQNTDLLINSSTVHMIGALSYGATSDPYDGYLAEINFIDGTALTAASFGETKDGIWIPKDTSDLTFGTNGFHLTFKDDVVSEGFNTVTYRGTGASNSISGVGFSPAFVWLKDRTDTTYNYLSDVCRGATNEIYSNATDGQYTGQTQTFKSFDGDGFTVGTNTGVNGSGDNMVGWCWEAGGTPTADNSAGAGNTPTAGSVKIDGSNLGSALGGSIAATRISANTAKGFSITTYTGTGGTKTVAHGLGATPAWVMVKVLDTQPTYWRVWHTGVTSGQNLLLNDGAADSAYDNRIGTNHTTSVVELIDGTSADDNVNDSGGSYVMYSWTDITGYSKFGSYTGNADANGPSVTLGFEPAWLLIKNRDASENWYIWDNTREPAPAQKNKRLHPNLNVIEQTSTGRSVTFTSTGFQVTGDDSSVNGDGNTLIYAAFADTREAAFFKDVTTNGNHFTPVNLDYRDSVPDVPTNNFATLNPLFNSVSQAVLSEGNLKAATAGFSSSVYGYGATSTFAIPKDKKIYMEVVCTDTTGDNWFAGFATQTSIEVGVGGNTGSDGSINVYNRGVKINGTETDYGASAGLGGLGVAKLAAGDILGCAIDGATGKVWFSRNGTYFKSPTTDDSGTTGDPSGGNHEIGTLTGGTTDDVFFVLGGGTSADNIVVNFGQDSSFSGLVATSNSNADGEGYGSFAYAPPSGFLALCSQNLPNAAIIDGTENFNTVLYTGNAGTQSITGVGFDPDFTWAKNRASASYHHELYDTVRGDNKRVFSSQADDEDTGYLQFISDGFSLTAGGGINANTNNHVAWNWLAGTAFSNDASATGVGTVDSAGQVNTDAGFSIVSYTGSTSESVGHGLSQAPECIFVKDRDAANNWAVYHQGVQDVTTNGFLELNASTSVQTGSNPRFLSGTAGTSQPTSTVFYVNNYSGSSTNTTGSDYIAYCFHSVEGYSKVGHYIGNYNVNGPFVYTGFRPAFIIIKSAVTSGYSWYMMDSTRTAYNGGQAWLSPDQTNVEDTSTGEEVDILSNGFKIRTNWTRLNDSSNPRYIYIAFAENPFKFANAR